MGISLPGPHLPPLFTSIFAAPGSDQMETLLIKQGAMGRASQRRIQTSTRLEGHKQPGASPRDGILKVSPERLSGGRQLLATTISGGAGGTWWQGSPFPRKRPPSRLLPRSGCIFEVGDFLTPPLGEC